MHKNFKLMIMLHNILHNSVAEADFRLYGVLNIDVFSRRRQTLVVI